MAARRYVYSAYKSNKKMASFYFIVSLTKESSNDNDERPTGRARRDEGSGRRAVV
jgi:hypothetical protein